MENKTILIVGSVLALVGLGIAVSFMLGGDDKDEAEDVQVTDVDTEEGSNVVGDSAPSISVEEPVEETPAPVEEPASEQQEDGEVDEKEALEKEFSRCSNLASKYFKGRSYAKAQEQFSKAIEIAEQLDMPQKSLITLYNNRGAMSEKLGELDSSMADCVTVLAMEPTHSKVRRRRARIFAQRKNYRGALVELCAVLLFERKQAIARGQNVMELMPPEELEGVVQEFGDQEVAQIVSSRPEPKISPSDSTVYQLLLSYTEFLDREKSARSQLPSALLTQVQAAEESNDQKALVTALETHAFRLMADKDIAGAAKDWYRIGDLLKENQELLEPAETSRLLRWVGFFNHVKSNFDTALELYDLAQKIHPHSDALVKKAGVYMDKNDLETAERLFQEAGETVDCLVHRSQLAVLKRDMESVQQDLSTVVQKYPSHVLAHLRLAMIKIHMGMVNEAMEHVNRAEELRPTLSEIFQVRGELALNTGNGPEALKLFERAIELDRTNATPIVDKAVTLFQTTMDAGLAVEELKKALEVDPTCALAHLRLAQIKLQGATEFDQTEEIIRDLEVAISQVRDKDELKELVMTKGITEAQIEGAKEIGLTSFPKAQLFKSPLYV